MQKDKGGKIMLDPAYGVAAGVDALYTIDGTKVIPSFLDAKGNLVTDKYGLPTNANFFLDLRDGSAYFKGTVNATDGVFNGTVFARDGEFTGKLKAAVLDGKLVGGTNGGEIEGVSLSIGNGAFRVDQSGNCKIEKGSISWGAVTGTEEIDNRINNAQSTADGASSIASSAKRIANTIIDGTQVISPNIVGGKITSLGQMKAECDFHVGSQIFLGGPGSSEETFKGIWFRSTEMYNSGGIYTNSTQNLTVNGNKTLNLIGDTLNLVGIGSVNWGKNAPTAVFA